MARTKRTNRLIKLDWWGTSERQLRLAKKNPEENTREALRAIRSITPPGSDYTSWLVVHRPDGYYMAEIPYTRGFAQDIPGPYVAALSCCGSPMLTPEQSAFLVDNGGDPEDPCFFRAIGFDSAAPILRMTDDVSLSELLRVADVAFLEDATKVR